MELIRKAAAPAKDPNDQVEKQNLAKRLKTSLGRRIVNYQKPKDEQKGPPTLLIIGLTADICCSPSSYPRI